MFWNISPQERVYRLNPKFTQASNKVYTVGANIPLNSSSHYPTVMNTVRLDSCIATSPEGLIIIISATEKHLQAPLKKP